MTTRENNYIEVYKMEVVKRLRGLFPADNQPPEYRVRDYVNGLEEWIRAIVAESQIPS